MMNKLQFRRGLKASLPITADVGMPLWCTDTQELYIGTGSGVVKIGGSSTTSDSYTKAEIEAKFNEIENLLKEV